MATAFTRAAEVVAHAVGHPVAVIAAAALVAGWAAVGPMFDWSEEHSLFINTITTIITFLMVFMMQHTQNRDGLAIQTKLDELIRSSNARNDYIGLDRKSEPEIENLRDQ